LVIHSATARPTQIAEDLQEGPGRLRVGHHAALLVGHGGDATRNAILHFFVQLVVKVGTPL
jgi:hypothetical protein